MLIEEYKVENDGIWISKAELIKHRNHYDAVQKHCGQHDSERLSRYYNGKVDVLNDVLMVILEEEKKNKKK